MDPPVLPPVPAGVPVAAVSSSLHATKIKLVTQTLKKARYAI
jgi:hypothetical protein